MRRPGNVVMVIQCVSTGMAAIVLPHCHGFGHTYAQVLCAEGGRISCGPPGDVVH